MLFILETAWAAYFFSVPFFLGIACRGIVNKTLEVSSQLDSLSRKSDSRDEPVF